MIKKNKLENSLVVKDSYLAKEWHPTKNKELKPEEVTVGSSKKVWWQCEKGHEWEAIVKSRKKSGCPYCSGLRVIKGETDLATINPKLAKQWHPTKNIDLKSSEVKSKSGKKVWWKCEKGHEWQSTVAERSCGTGCPYCSGHRVIKGETDLATLNPELTKEWHPTKNGKLKPSKLAAKSNKKVWWRCGSGHEWETNVANRSKGNSCPYCSGKRVIKGETDLATINPELGKEWHLKKNGSLKPCDVKVKSNKKVWWQCENGHEWESLIANRSKGNGCPYCSGQRAIKGETDLATLNPELAKEWHPTKNGKLKPSELTVKSGKRVWWRCENGHEWLTNVANRSRTGCPYCSGKRAIEGETGSPYCSSKRAIKGETDLATLNPELAKEWHPTKNGKLKPSELTIKSGKRAWWRCENGHEWESSIANRSRGNGCPYCSGQRAIKGETDLATLNPELAKEWNFTKNGNLKPNDVKAMSNKKVWWKCENCHEWESNIDNRTKGNGCPYCSGHRAIKGETDLATLNPELAKEWNPTKNGKLKPSEITIKSSKKVWWECENSHEWQSTVANRSKAGCPYCSGKRAIKGETDLETLNPELAREWHHTKNGKLKPCELTEKSGKRVWWRCKNGHEWRAMVYSRSIGCGCPECRRSDCF